MRKPELLDDPRFAEMASRYANRRELDAIIGEWTAPLDPYWVMHRLQAARVPAGVVMNEADAFNDRQHAARDFFQTVTNPETGTQRQVGRAWHASRTPRGATRHAPHLGQDNEYVYREVLGYSEAEFARFEELGHIGTEYDADIP
jgi:crotonobetainyl-CoA:carnitine CoA-transferase CaiB-like acyl-CoA transferase